MKKKCNCKLKPTLFDYFIAFVGILTTILIVIYEAITRLL